MLTSTGRRYLLSVLKAPYAAIVQAKDTGIGPLRDSHHTGTLHGFHWLFSTGAAPAADDRTPDVQQQQQQQQEHAAPAGQPPNPQQQNAASSQPHMQPLLNSAQQSRARNPGFRKVDPDMFGDRNKQQATTRKQGIVHILSTMNNTHLVLTDRDSNVQTWVSGGTVGYKNANKATPMAAELAAKELARRAKDKGFHAVVVKLKGVGKNKQFAVQSLASSGLTVTQIWDVTPIAYNGCRLPKRRRV